MRILVVGKDNIMKWPQSTYNALRSTSHSTKLFLYNKKTLSSCIMDVLGKKTKQWYRAKKFEKCIRSYQPDIILIVSAFLLPSKFFDVLKKFPDIVKAGWCGDKFSNDKEKYANCFDFLFCTDTGFLKLAQNFHCQSYYLPLCADRVFEFSEEKTIPPFFACGLNAERQKYLSHIQTRCLLYLKNCPKDALPQHDVHHHTISHDKMLQLMHQSVCPINIGLSVNNVHGLNFRVFETGATGGLIMVNKECTDIEQCYCVGKEAVVYDTPEDLDNLITDITSYPEKYARIAKAGYERTVKEHTYVHRMEQMLQLIQKHTK